MTPGKIGTAAIVDTIAAGELGHVDRGQLQRLGRIYVPTVEAAAIPTAGLAGNHAIGANARDRHRQVRGRVDRSIEIGRAACRARVCKYVNNSVVAVSLKKKKKK